MIRNTVVNTLNFFYPLGNTPAVSLTQDLPVDQDAEILLLGCGDVRNVLFTTFADPGRKLDVTCNDVEPAIIARNILLYTLLVDDASTSNSDQIWDIYYHWMLDNPSIDLLERQVEKLLSLSKSLPDWRGSIYGPLIHFCDVRTLTKVRAFWQTCSSRGMTSIERLRRNNIWQIAMDKAKNIRKDRVGDGLTLNGYRSAGPFGILSVQDFVAVAKQWWSTGSCFSNRTSSTHLNPSFLSSANQGLTLHYGTEPLLGFPLAIAYFPLLNDSRLHVKKERLSNADYLSTCARQHFQLWSEAFVRSVSHGTVLRFCVADALTLSLTLLKATPEADGRLMANLYCDNWTSEFLALENEEYTRHHSPRRFNIIDTSNLIDHLGPMNMLPVCASLLKREPSSTVYTECLVQHDASAKDRLVNLLAGDLRTTALLIGLSPCEVWTNATNSPEDEPPLHLFNKTKSFEEKAPGTTQVRSRLRWKRTHESERSELSPNLHIEPSTAAQLLAKTYSRMFHYEDVGSLLADLSLKNLAKKSSPCYNRASFVLLLTFIRETVNTDWPECVNQMLQRIFSDSSKSMIGNNFIQELLLYLHMLDVDTTLLPAININTDGNVKMASFFKSWTDIPVQVCMTIRVPRENLTLFTSKQGTTIGIPTLRCNVEGGGVISRSWSNIFSCVQVAFGEAECSVQNGTTALQIVEDESAWWGQSDMFVSTFIPTWMILQPDGAVPTAKCGLLPTLQSTQAFVVDLGITLDIFTAAMTSESVCLSRYMPGMTGLPKSLSEGIKPQPHPTQTMHIVLNSNTTMVTKLIHRVNIISEAAKAHLSNQSTKVAVHFQDPLRASMTIGKTFNYPIDFPIPVVPEQYKVRIARKSSYVETEAPLWNPLAETSCRFLFPTAPPSKLSEHIPVPVSSTAARLNLDVLPQIDIRNSKKLDLLNPHVSLMFSAQERRVREAGMPGQLPPGIRPIMRLEIKEGLFSILMQYLGLERKPVKFFGLGKEKGGINVLILPSCLRLDLVSRTVVLDTAAIPLLDKMSTSKKVQAFYQSLGIEPMAQIKVSDEELRCWKTLLPALVERCRTWGHGSKCEYALKNEVPIIQGLEDGFSPLCSCGIGKFPTGFLKDSKLNNVEYVLGKYATRVALSPIFALPYVEDCFLGNSSVDKPQINAPNSEGGCAQCGRITRKNEDSGGAALLTCSRCKSTKYCSAECQKANWKFHKISCRSR